MRTFAQNPKATQQITSAKPTIPSFGNQAAKQLLEANAEELNAAPVTSQSKRLLHNFSQVPIHPPAARASSLPVMRTAESEHWPGQTQHGRPDASERAEVPISVHEVLHSTGQPLDGHTRDFMETRFNHDFKHVRVHTDLGAAKSARSVNAVAYTVGNDIAFDTGRYVPATQQGQYLLAHELTHVVQQSGQPASHLDKLSRTEPSDSHELEANAVAAAVTGGGSVPSWSASGVMLARQEDGDGADAGPMTPPVAPTRAPAPAAPPAPPPVTPPSATFGKVAADARADRIPPTKSVTVPVTLANIPPGSSVNIDVQGSGGANGSATLTAGATLAASGNVTVRGGTQTSPGNASKLKLRATVGSTVVGLSAGFTVAAYPINYTSTFLSDINDGSLLGMVVHDTWSSDGSGPMSELNEVEISERVDNQSRDNPPFTIAGASSATSGTSGYIAADTPVDDTFQMAKAGIVTTGLGVGMWTRVQGQLSLFKCKRTGVTDMVMPESGYRIVQVVANALPPPFSPSFRHRTAHAPSAITVEGRTATPGGPPAGALSPEHIL